MQADIDLDQHMSQAMARHIDVNVLHLAGIAAFGLLSAVLADYGLLEPFTMQAKLNPDKGGAAMQLTGMQRVNEKNLENLNAAQLKNLIRKGFLARIYLHLLSLDNFTALLERKAARQPKA